MLKFSGSLLVPAVKNIAVCRLQRTLYQARSMAAAAKLSQGELTEAAQLSWAGKPPLVDIGLNLADSSFDEVRIKLLALY